jgi:hypothetical protein
MKMSFYVNLMMKLQSLKTVETKIAFLRLILEMRRYAGRTA